MGSRKTRRTVVAVAIGALLLAACGGGGSSDKQAAAPNDAGDAPESTTTTTHVHDGSHSHPSSAIPPAALPVRADGTLDPDQIDLSGVEGVTPDQQKRAEDLLRSSINTLPRWNDVEKAKADGFQSIGDSLTGEEHYLHWDWIEDDVLFDPTQPESLVYKVNMDGTRTLEAAMFILPKEYTLDSLPNVGGALMQFHVHDDLCFSKGDQPVVVGITSVGGPCPDSQEKFNPSAMVHVWIRPNVCGPFAALQGIGAGQIKDGETRACDAVHGRLTL